MNPKTKTEQNPAQQALATIHSLIEQCVAGGAFKKLVELDHVREAWKTLDKTINPKTE